MSGSGQGVGVDGILYVLLDPGRLGPQVDLAEIGKSLPGFTLHTLGLTQSQASAGDFDGDGFDDLVVSDHFDVAPDVFSAYLFFGREEPEGAYDLEALGETGDGVQRFLTPLTPEVPVTPFFADSVAGTGDVNGDGFDDILIGETYLGANERGETVNGKVHLVLGGPRWSRALAIDEVPAERRKVFHGLGGEGLLRDHFGSGVAAPGDINGDGLPDLLMSANRRTDESGEAYLIHGRGDFPDDTFLADGFEGIRIAGANVDGGLGWFLGRAGDFNGDGRRDFLVGEPPLSVHAGGGGAFVILGTGAGLTPLTVVDLEPAAGFLRGGTAVRIRGSGFEDGARVEFGARGAPVLAVSATELLVETPVGLQLGEVAVTVMVGERMVTAPERFEYVPDRPELDLLSPGSWGLRIDDTPGTVLGLSLDFCDIDGDGRDDLLIGSDLVTDWAVTVVRGGRGLPETMEAFTAGPRKSQIVKRAAESRLFFAVQVRSVGDVNADGIADLGVAAWQESSYLFFGRRQLEAELDFEAEVEAGRAVRLIYNPDRIGNFAPVGDLTGDGIEDFAMGLWFEGIVFVAGRREWPAELDLEEGGGATFARLWNDGDQDRFGDVFALAGDVNDDGYPDLLASGNTGELQTAYLVFTRPDMPSGHIDDHVAAGGGVLFEWLEGSGFVQDLWINVGGPGDVNGDGIDDFLLAHEEGTFSVPFQGVTYLVYGRREFPTRVEFPYDMSPIETEGVVRLGTDDVDQAGRCVGPAGDYNGDGHADFLVGSQNQGSADFYGSGRMHVVLGAPDLPPVLDLGNLRRHGFRLEGIRRTTFMNVAGFSAGDLNDDGAPDFAFTELSSPFWELEDGSVPPGSVHVVFGIPPSVSFIRGDADGDGRLNITDGVFTLSHLFLGGVNPLCEDATDADDRGTVELTDAVYLLNHLFLGGPAPPAPYPLPGSDPTADQLGCRGF